MATMLRLIVLLILIAGVTSSGIVLPEAVSIQLTCTDDDYTHPIWILQGQVIDDIPLGQKEELGVNLLQADIEGSRISSFVHINGSLAIHNMTLKCSIRREIVYSNILLYQALPGLPANADLSTALKHLASDRNQLPAPTNLTASNDGGSTIMIEWVPPILDPPVLQGTELDHVQIHMNPNILVYSLTITDTTNGTTLPVKNMTQTSYGFTGYIPCHRYQFQVSAWNAAGEGERETLHFSLKALATLRSGEVSAVASTQAMHTRKRQQQGAITISFSVQMNVSCPAKLPDFFDVRVTGNGLPSPEIREIPYNHSIVVSFTIMVTGVEGCTDLRVEIRGRNSAGRKSQFIEIPVECQPIDHSTATTPTARTTGSGGDSTPRDPVGQDQQGDNMIYTAIGAAVGAVVIVGVVALSLIIILWKCKRTTKVKSSEENVYTKSPSLASGKTPINQTAAISIKSPTASPTASPNASLASSTDSTDSNTPLLPQPKPPPKTPTECEAAEGNPQLVYAKIDPAKHSLPQPPSGDNQVQYAQIQHQD